MKHIEYCEDKRHLDSKKGKRDFYIGVGVGIFCGLMFKLFSVL